MRNDSETILQIVDDASTMISKMGGILVAVVGDNHAGLQLGIEKFVTKHPSVFPIRCAAHSIQV